MRLTARCLGAWGVALGAFTQLAITGAARAATPDASGAAPPGASHASAPVTWSCAGEPCPWGRSQSGNAVVWPAHAAAGRRLGYTVSAGIYLPAEQANGMTISLAAGTARVNAGRLDADPHRVLTTLTTSSAPYLVTGIVPGEVVSVQGREPFRCLTTPPPPDPVVATDVPAGKIVQASKASWYCATPGCGPPWPGAVIPWPSWAALQGNGRKGPAGRLVFSSSGRPLYPYMGVWADGCRITARSGKVSVIEWKYGSETWRKTWLQPGQSHVIRLRPPEDGALIETEEGGDVFSVTLKNCAPPPPPAPAPKH